MSNIFFSAASFKNAVTIDIASVRSMFQQAASDDVACKKLTHMLVPVLKKSKYLTTTEKEQLKR